jgi:hypothetical protein
LGSAEVDPLTAELGFAEVCFSAEGRSSKVHSSIELKAHKLRRITWENGAPKVEVLLFELGL